MASHGRDKASLARLSKSFPYCGAATRLWGVIAMMDSIAASFPRHTAKKVEKSAAGEEIAIDVEGDPAIFVFKTVADPFVGKMSFFKVMNGSGK